MKRLYTVTVEFDFAVLADSEVDAKSYANKAIDDLYLGECTTATLTVYSPGGGIIAENLPAWDQDSLVYGADEDTTLEEAVAAERSLLQQEFFAQKQGDLFAKDK